ncbi:MAG: DUF2092 domain-containing protein [Aestuariivirga sp.]|nr:DUF2092 domain-containing protein [Aestuariivirga sp.]
MGIHPGKLIIGFVAAAVLSAAPAMAQQDEAKSLFKAMTDFMAAQPALSVNFDSTIEIVTTDLEKVGFAGSGTLSMSRPDKIRMTRSGGLADVELVFDGKTLAAYGKKLNVFAKMPVTGDVDQLIDMLRFEHGLELPAADLLSPNAFDIMMSNVTDAKALGAGIVRGQSCDHLAFRTADTDWQIWIAPGDKPFPCRFTITSKMTALAPSYDIVFSDWKGGPDVAADDFQLKPAEGAREVKFNELEGLEEVPAPNAEGGAQ